MTFRKVDLHVPFNERPCGIAKPVALINLSPGEIDCRLGIKFERMIDDLDDVDVAMIQCDNGKFIALHWYPRAPVKGTVLLVDEKSATLDQELASALDYLQLTKEDLLWSLDSHAGELGQGANS